MRSRMWPSGGADTRQASAAALEAVAKQVNESSAHLSQMDAKVQQFNHLTNAINFLSKSYRELVTSHRALSAEVVSQGAELDALRNLWPRASNDMAKMVVEIVGDAESIARLNAQLPGSPAGPNTATDNRDPARPTDTDNTSTQSRLQAEALGKNIAIQNFNIKALEEMCLQLGDRVKDVEAKDKRFPDIQATGAMDLGDASQVKNMCQQLIGRMDQLELIVLHYVDEVKDKNDNSTSPNLQGRQLALQNTPGLAPVTPLSGSASNNPESPRLEPKTGLRHSCKKPSMPPV